jgi:multidrug resistance efflux pump
MVTEVYVKAGDQIMKGQRLFSVDDRDTRAALAAKAAADDASVQVRLIESVTDRRAVREEDIERRRAALAQANARVVEAEKSLSLLKAGAWGPDLQVARISVKQAQAAVEQSQIDLERLTSLAPINGVILQNHVRVGQYASCAGTSEPLMIIGSSGALNLRVDISENDAWRVKEGASGTAYVRGNAALHYPVTFVRTEPYVLPKRSLTGDATERVDTRVLQVIYRFDDVTAHLFVGQQMDLYVRGNSAVEQVSATRPELAGGR